MLAHGLDEVAAAHALLLTAALATAAFTGHGLVVGRKPVPRHETVGARWEEGRGTDGQDGIS